MPESELIYDSKMHQTIDGDILLSFSRFIASTHNMHHANNLKNTLRWKHHWI